jgi:hypothetical protein
MALYYMKKLTTILLLAIFAQPVFAQTHILPKFIRKMYFEKDTTKKGSFVILPVISSAPETGLEARRLGPVFFLYRYAKQKHKGI